MIGAELLSGIADLCASTGSACHEESEDISPVLRAMDVAREVAIGAVRLSLGRFSTEEEVGQVIEAVADQIRNGA
jgi:cysteine desulfurase